MAFYNNYADMRGYQQPYYGAPLPDRMAQPQTYQQPQIPAQLPQQQTIQQNNGIIWVQGEEGAKAYLVAPNSTVVLWDSETPVIYIKSADMSGMPTMRVFDLTERTAQKATPYAATGGVEYATRGEFDELVGKVNELIEREQRRQERYEKKKGGAVNNG